MEEEFCRFGFLRWPRCIGMPAIRPALKRSVPPRGLCAYAVQIVAEEWRLNTFAKFARGFMSAERNDADGIAFGGLPFAVEPWARDNDIRVIGIVLLGFMKNLPRTPRVLLIPESGNV